MTPILLFNDKVDWQNSFVLAKSWKTESSISALHALRQTDEMQKAFPIYFHRGPSWTAEERVSP